MTAVTATDHRSVWVQAADRLDREQAIPPRSWPVTDADIPAIGIELVQERPDVAWTVSPSVPPREPTAVEQDKYDSRRLREDWAWLYGAETGILPPPPRLVTGPFVAEVPPAGPAATVPEGPAAIPGQAAERLGLGPLDPHAEAVAAQFIADHEAEDKRTATVTIPAVDAITTITPTVTPDGAP